MQKTKLIRLVELFAVIPMATMSTIPAVPISQVAINIVSSHSTLSSQKLNISTYSPFTFNQQVDPKVAELEAKAEAINAYFRARGMPLEGTGMTMVQEAEKNDLDWRLLAAIAVRESTGGKHDCIRVENNAFGWGSCKINFKSNEEAIQTVARNLGGNNPNTAHHYEDKTTIQILRAYNPPSIVPRYAQQVISIMNVIGEPDTEPAPVLAIANT